MTWTSLQSSPTGYVIYLLEIVGVGVFTTHDYTPSDGWFSTAGYGSGRVYPWMKFDGLGPIKEDIEPIDFGGINVPDITVEIVDLDDQMTALMKGLSARESTRLTADLSSTASTASVESTQYFASSGYIYPGDEAIAYTSTAATQFLGLSRGKLGTTARTFDVDFSGFPPKQVYVVDGPVRMDGRRAYLHAAEYDPDTDTVSETTVIYRGTVQNKIRFSKGSWSFPIKHISKVLKEKVGQQLPTTKIPAYQYYYNGQDFYSIGFNKLDVENVSASTASTSEITPDEGLYLGPDSLAEEFNTKVNSSGLTIKPSLTYNGEKYIMTAGAVSSKRFHLNVPKYSPIWALGFNAGEYTSDTGIAYAREADEKPRMLVVDLRRHTDTPYIIVEDSTDFIAGNYVLTPGNPYAKIDSVSTASNEIYLANPDLVLLERQWSVEDDEEQLELKHAFVTPKSTDWTLKNALKKYLWLYSGQGEPESWCASGSLDTDWDWDELDDALASVPEALIYFWATVKKGNSVEKIIGPVFSMLGISPRITTDGKIGFVRIESPIETNAIELEVDSEVWEQIDSVQTSIRMNQLPLLNLIFLQYGKDYRKDSGGWKPPLKLYWDDGFNNLRETRSVGYECLGLHAIDISSLALANTIRVQTLGTHFGMFARNSFTVDIPVTWKAKQIRCGDIVKVTHELAKDPLNGVTGLASRLGVVVGKEQQLSASRSDSLSIRFGPDVNTAGIAPTARATSYVTSTATMTFSSAGTPEYEQSGGNDLDRFAVQDTVLLVERDVTTSATIRGTIQSIGSTTVTFSSDPLSGNPFPSTGMYMVLPEWDYCNENQQDYAFNASAAANPVLGSTSDAPKVWSI